MIYYCTGGDTAPRRSVGASAFLCIALVLSALLAASACTSNRMHRPAPEDIQHEADYSLAFIEFDDQGELWSPSQMFRTIELIEEANQAARKSIFVVFIHGWQNNASPEQEQEKGKSLHGFKLLLSQVAERARIMEGSSVPVIGIYLAWRGKSAYKPFHGLTFWNRRRTANRIASGSAVTEVLTRIVETIGENPDSNTVLIGHSFGGLLMEQALVQTIVGSVIREKTGRLDLGVDLVLLINPASPSIRAKQLIEVFARERAKLYQVDSQGRRYERPLMISVTSETDMATRALYPMGTSLGLIFTRFRTYGSEFCSPAANQRSFYLYTAGHNKVLHSHIVTEQPLSDEGGSQKELDVQRGYDPISQQETISFNGRKHRFTIKRKPRALNDTPYWIMNVPKSLIPDHSDIFGVDTVRLMAALVQGTGVLEPNSYTELVRETDLNPIGIAVRSNGELVIAERSRRLYALRAGSSRAVFLSCLPEDLDPADTIGLLTTGDTLNIAISRSLDKGDKEKREQYRTELLKVSLVKGGFRKAVPGRLAGSMRFFAATGDAAEQKLYLAAEGGIYVADLSQSRPEPKLLVSIDFKPERMAFNSATKQLFAIDNETGRLYLLALRDETPQVRLVAEGLGWPADIVVAPTDGRIYIPDTKHKQIWRLKCEDVRCTKPEVFARHDGFRAPSRVAVAPDNTLWVADPTAKKIFAFGPDGNIRQTISSLAGTQQEQK